MACIESSFGVAKASPVLGTDSCYLRLSESSAFKAELVPQTDIVNYGGGRVTPAAEVTDTFISRGTIKTVLYPGIWTNLLLKWSIDVINTGRTTPWTTTDASSLMPAGDLASLAFYEAAQLSDGNYVRVKWLGNKCTKWTLSFSSGPQARKLILDADFIGIKCVTNTVEGSPPAAPDATEFPAPAEADYPTVAWKFSDFTGSTGTAKIGSARSQIESVSISGENSLDARNYETKFNEIIRFLGRKTTADVMLRYKPSPDDLASYQSRTVLDSEFKIDNGSNTLKIDFNAINRLAGHDREYDDGREYGRKLSLQNYWSPATSSDIDLTVT